MVKISKFRDSFHYVFCLNSTKNTFAATLTKTQSNLRVCEGCK